MNENTPGEGAAQQPVRRILFENGSYGENHHTLLIHSGDRVEFSAGSMDREIGRMDTCKANFRVEDFRRAVDEVKSKGSSKIIGIGAMESATLNLVENKAIAIHVTEFGGSFWFQVPLSSIELED